MNFSQINDTLYIGSAPRSEAYATLRELGITLVINMRVESRPARDPHGTPIPVLWLPAFDSPLFGIPILLMRRGVEAGLKEIERGGRLYVHCAQGVHRAAAMGAAILIAQGASAEEAIQLIKERRPAADPDIWYIRRQILRFAQGWKD